MAEESKSSAPGTSANSKRGRRRIAENAIEPVVVAERHRVEDKAVARLRATLSGPEPRFPRDNEPIADRSPDSGAAARQTSAPASTPDRWHIPDDVAMRFVRVGRSYYFQNGAPAFDDHGRKLSTKSENTELVRNLIQIAEARGWEEITVSGTERFRQKVWRAATLEGLIVRGYKPTEVEQAQVVRALARQSRESVERGSDSAPASAEHRVNRDRAPAPAPSSTVEQPASQSKEGKERAKHRASEAIMVGRLLEHGLAPFKFKPDEDMSYYVKLRTDQGERIRWGRDLQRAIEQGATRPKVGDLVGVQRTGQEPVTVNAKEHDREGRVVGEGGERIVQRNRWAVEHASYFVERSTTARILRDAHLDVQRAAREHPELAGTYLTLKAAQEFAAERIQNRDERKRFVAAVAEKITHAAERGEPLPQARLKDRPRTGDRKLPSTHDRDLELVPR
jgi:hypothetical protein